MSTWTPNDVRKLISQTSGIALAIYGITLIVNDVRASGKINFTTSLISGQVESGSAGILLLFFSIILIIVPTISFRKLRSESEALTVSEKKSRLNFKARFIIGILLGIILSFALNYFGKLSIENGLNIGNLLIIGSFIIGTITGIGLVILVITFITGELDTMSEPNEDEVKK